MSSLDELIQELCLDGVEYKRLGDCCYLQKGTTPIQKAIPGEYPLVVTTDERKSSNTYQFDAPTVCIPLISSRGHGVACLNQVYYQEGKFALGNILCGATPKTESGLSARFLYYYLNYKKDTLIVPLMKGGANVSLTVDSLKHVKVAVPPLDVQVEIVCILDKFIALSTELKAELTARKKQYEYYRDILLEKHIGTEKVKLSTICEIYDGTHQTPKYTDGGIPFVSVENIGDLYGTTKYISEEAYAKFKIKPQIGDVFMTRITAGVIGKCAVVNRNDDLAYYVSLALLRPNMAVLDSRYLKHYLESGFGKRELHKRILWNATPTKINKEDIGKLDILIPPLGVQKHLVSVLDNFDALCSDLTSGLPAEIEARKKQYEYYRDRLLTFRERGCDGPFNF